MKSRGGTTEYRSIRDLLKKECSTQEFPNARLLLEQLREAKEQGYFIRSEFLQMCEWKSPRARRHFRLNTEVDVKRVSTQVFQSQDERRRIDLLNSLVGVGIPMASAILTLTDPKRYGVIDVRTWTLLYEYGEVHQNSSGRSLSPKNWLDYLRIIRNFAQDFNVTPRDIDRTLFLYGRPTSAHGTHY